MTGAAFRAEWRRAQECLGAARYCQGGGFYADAVSRAYYAVMHAAKAALALHNVRPRSHSAVANRFGPEHRKGGVWWKSTWGREFGSLASIRISADYGIARIFSDADAQDACGRAELFLDRIRPLLGDATP